jgi:cytoskeletal protein CcmA (bactofilin family)
MLQWRDGGASGPSSTSSPRPSDGARSGEAFGGTVQTGRVAEPVAKLLIVGPEITLSGEITACDRLVVEGSVRVTLNRTRAIEISRSGRFTDGRAEVEEADIAGLYEGELTVRGRLLIRGTGRVAGKVRYGELEIERGGKLSGAVAALEAASEPVAEPVSSTGMTQDLVEPDDDSEAL